ncbi:MAG: primosomal protein N' [Gammaproteobacteria bacterium]|nr:primosomal protein N' [Gammaproteobacteria bacterium]
MNNKKTIILRIAVPTPLRKSFDYYAPEIGELPVLEPGIRVRVPFQHRELIGILLEVCSDTGAAQYKLKPALEIIDQTPVIPKDILALSLWAADYYHHPVGDVLDTALPVLLRQGKPAELSKESYWQITEQGLQVDLAALKRAPRQVELLKWIGLHPEGVSKKLLDDHDIAPSILRAVCEKGWVEKSLKSVMSDVMTTTTPENIEKALTLNPDQQAALTAIQSHLDAFQVFLLDGVTGSGKTEVYLQAITDVLAKQKQVLVLVPEIGLTPQTIQRFRQRFAVPVVALHSGLTDKERLNAWVAAKSGAARIIIGTRSAIFSPFANLGLIVVDEEHDLSFKQQDGFRYHARDLAIMRAHSHEIPIILGSATPSLETLARAMQGRYQHLRLPERAGVAEQPTFCVLDIRNIQMEEGLSPSLVNAMREHLNNGDQVMLFLNRRGFAPILMCHACGWMAKCKRCDARMTFHHDPRRLHCHHCDSRKPIFKQCEVCKAPDLQIIGLGTERLEIAIQKHFPDFSIARIDRDSTQRKGSMENILESIHSGEHRILIGTQMLAKGHHFPNVTLVGIIDTDGGFFSSDFRAIERMGQLVLQVSGRAGRVSKPGTVVIQTHHPDNPLLHQLIRESYYYFATTLLKEREMASMPPYAFLALFRAEAQSMEHAMQFLQQIKDVAKRLGENIPIWGPVPAPMARRAGRFRVQLLLQAKQRPHLQRCLTRLLPEIEKLRGKQQVRWSLDVDPLEMF